MTIQFFISNYHVKFMISISVLQCGLFDGHKSFKVRGHNQGQAKGQKYVIRCYIYFSMELGSRMTIPRDFMTHPVLCENGVSIRS